LRRTYLLLFLIIVTTTLYAGQPKEFKDWPAGSSPREVGNRVANRFISTIDLSKESQVYPGICTWYGALTFAKTSANPKLASELTSRFEQQATPELLKTVLDKQHVDYSMLGSVPFEIYLQTKDAKYLAMGKQLANHQWEQPLPDGLTRETRFWIDDMYMITILQVQAYRATGDKVYLDRAALEMEAYLDKLQQPSGLFFHAPDVPFLWGRGDGWVAAGLTELLRSFGARSETRPIWRMNLLANSTLLAVVAVSFGLQVWSHHNAFLAKFLKTSLMSFDDCLMILAISTVPLLVLEARKVFLRRQAPPLSA